MNIRRAEVKDVPAITAIYNDAILHLTVTFISEPKTLAEQYAWLEAHGDNLPVLVAEEDGVLLGWASLSKWSTLSAYSSTAEASMYMSEGKRNKGIGRKLFTALMAEGEQAGLHTVIARIVQGNEASIHLCNSLGFTRIGTIKQIGRKFGRLLDLHMMQFIYPGRD